MAANINAYISAHKHGPYKGDCGREKKADQARLYIINGTLMGCLTTCMHLQHFISFSVISHGHNLALHYTFTS